jgi:hypothetical protein
MCYEHIVAASLCGEWAESTMSVATPRVPLSSRAASARWTTGSAAPRAVDMLPASTIAAVATAPPRVPNHKRARSPDVEHHDDDGHKRSRGSGTTAGDDKITDARARERHERQQQREHYRNSYLKAFPNFVFYFDNVDSATKHRQAQMVISLGAVSLTVSQFFWYLHLSDTMLTPIPDVPSESSRSSLATSHMLSLAAPAPA